MSLKTKRGWQLACLPVLAGLLSSATNVPVTSAGRVTYASGIVNVRKAQLVGAGYRLRTGHNGRVELTFANGHRLRVAPRSDLLLVAVKPQQTLMRLDQGRAWNNVKPGQGSRVNVRTRYSTATVLGTIYDTSLGTAEASTTVLKGSVGVRLPENLPEQSLFEQLPPLPAISAPPISSFQAPTQIARPVHEVTLPLRVVPGPYEVTQDQWLQIVENQRISLGSNGKAQITTVTPTEVTQDEWFRWNQQMDSQTQQ